VSKERRRSSSHRLRAVPTVGGSNSLPPAAAGGVSRLPADLTRVPVDRTASVAVPVAPQPRPATEQYHLSSNHHTVTTCRPAVLMCRPRRRTSPIVLRGMLPLTLPVMLDWKSGGCMAAPTLPAYQSARSPSCAGRAPVLLSNMYMYRPRNSPPPHTHINNLDANLIQATVPRSVLYFRP
jgi:hypothetical protein